MKNNCAKVSTVFFDGMLSDPMDKVESLIGHYGLINREKQRPWNWLWSREVRSLLSAQLSAKVVYRQSGWAGCTRRHLPGPEGKFYQQSGAWIAVLTEYKLVGNNQNMNSVEVICRRKNSSACMQKAGLVTDPEEKWHTEMSMNWLESRLPLIQFGHFLMGTILSTHDKLTCDSWVNPLDCWWWNWKMPELTEKGFARWLRKKKLLDGNSRTRFCF